MLHRDLKPGNVMLREDGSVALIDFGLAKQIALDAEITGAGEIFGTPYYMSPEQGHGREVDVRSRPLQPRRHLLRDADRQEAVHGADADGRHLQAHARADPAAALAVPGPAAAGQPPAGQAARAPLPDGGGARRRVAVVAATWQPQPTLHDMRRDL